MYFVLFRFHSILILPGRLSPCPTINLPHPPKITISLIEHIAYLQAPILPPACQHLQLWRPELLAPNQVRQQHTVQGGQQRPALLGLSLLHRVRLGRGALLSAITYENIDLIVYQSNKWLRANIPKYYSRYMCTQCRYEIV